MANSSAVTILDFISSAKTVSTIDSMYTAAGSPSATNILTVQPSTAQFSVSPNAVSVLANKISSVIASSGTNSTLISSAASVLYGAHFYCNAATPRFVKIYNLSSAPTAGTSSILFTVGVPPGAVRDVTLVGAQSSIGLGYTITGAITSTDATVVAADDVHGIIEFR